MFARQLGELPFYRYFYNPQKPKVIVSSPCQICLKASVQSGNSFCCLGAGHGTLDDARNSDLMPSLGNGGVVPAASGMCPYMARRITVL